MRKPYLDNLRTIMILLLFPLHTLMLWNDYGNSFYIWGGENRLLSSLIILVNPWIMALLFTIAGISAKYSLEKRRTKTFLKERLVRLMLPFLGGLILLIPAQTLYARKFHFDYNGGLLEHFRYFFTHATDLSGNDGAFTPGHLWFILFLFVISLLAMLIIKYLPTRKLSAKIENLNLATLILLFIPIWLMSYLGTFGVYSLGRYFTLYLLGYYLFTNETLLKKLLRYKIPILGSFFVAQVTLFVLYYNFAYYGDLLVNLVGWLGVLAGIIIGKTFLDRETRLTHYFRQSSYSLYILHLTVLVIVAYYVFNIVEDLTLQILLIMFGSFVATILAYEVIRHIPLLRRFIGLSSIRSGQS